MEGKLNVIIKLANGATIEKKNVDYVEYGQHGFVIYWLPDKAKHYFYDEAEIVKVEDAHFNEQQVKKFTEEKNNA